jgi:hypothetical protein
MKLSSLLSKLKALVQASARGPRRRQKAPGKAQTAEQQATSVPEVTEATAQQRARAEVTEASPAQVAQAHQAAARQPAHDLAESEPGKAPSGALEEERVVDILKGKQT